MIAINGYTISENIYNSANSVVYRGVRIADQRPVMLKILNRDYPTPQEIARFKKEHEITVTLQTVENVIRVYALEAYKNSFVMVLEDFGGTSLHEILRQRKFSLEEFLTLAFRICSVLGRVHQHRIIHKDINPSNIIWNSETDRLKLIDFGISTSFVCEQAEPLSFSVLEGTLAYISPEQTGRMNQRLDYRTDFYSLGVTFYELLLGALPFRTEDTMELVHCHLAKSPSSPNEINRHIPRAVSDMLMKLMAKSPAARYQSAEGILADLRKCLEQLRFSGAIRYVAIGQEDRPETFQIPQRLYGRAAELETLQGMLQCAGEGESALAMVSGESGMGKTLLIHELHVSILEHHGYFITGRFEQFKHNVPFSGIIQALQNFLRQLLMESEPQLYRWKEHFKAVLGPDAWMLKKMLPELSIVLGQPSQNEQLPAVDTHNRLPQLLAELLQAASAPEHPLVILLDNVQWADSASLKCLEQILTSPEGKGILAIGAYREHNATSIHPLRDFIEKLRKHPIEITQIMLRPLSLQDVKLFLAETLRRDPDELVSLAELVLQKTGGNPFAMKTFLHTMDAEGVLTFDAHGGCWGWKLEQIQGLAMTENMIDFMLGKIRKFSTAIQRTLQFAACIGTRFDLRSLATLLEISETATVARLKQLIEEGIVVPTDESYRYVSVFPNSELTQFAPYVFYDFVHHRFQEAALELIPPTERGKFHLKIGRYMLQQENSPQLKQEHLSEIVDHLNLGLNDLITPQERLELADLNLLAGKQAKASGDYPAARQYLAAGRELVGVDGWQRHYRLTFDLLTEQADIEKRSGNFEQAEVSWNMLQEHAQTLDDQIIAYTSLIRQYTLQGRYNEALQRGMLALRSLGIEWEKEQDFEVRATQELAEIDALTREKNLAHVPLLSDASPRLKLTMRVLNMLLFPAKFVDPSFYRLIVARMMRISLIQGHVAESASGYAHYGALLGTRQGKYRSGYEFGLLAKTLSEGANDAFQKSHVLNTLAVELSGWVKHLKFAHNLEHEAYHCAIDADEAELAGLTMMSRILTLFYEGASLDLIHKKLPEFIEFARSIHHQLVCDVMTGCALILQNLRDLTPEALSFDTNSFTEEKFLLACRTRQSPFALEMYTVMKIQVLYLYGFPKKALFLSRERRAQPELLQTFFIAAAEIFYVSLSICACYATCTKHEKQRYGRILKENQRQLSEWAKQCPENFRHCSLLVAAECARIHQQPFLAMQRYQQAIEAANEQKFVQHKALAHELAAQFYQERGFLDFAEIHLYEAYYNYGLWGAKRKVNELLKAHPALVEDVARKKHEKHSSFSSTSISLRVADNGVSALDLSTAMKASQTISENIVLADLLKEMMKIVLENAGAQHGWLIRQKERQWVIDAEGASDSGQVTVLQAIPLESVGSMKRPILPSAILQYVIRTQEAVVLRDAAHEGSFTHDPYISKRQVKSVLCTPLIKRGTVNGVIYLENNFSAGAFTPDRLNVLKILSAQMVISIENATLYKQLRESLNQQITLSHKQVELTNAYSRFIPKEFLRLLGKKSIVDVRLGEQVEKEITVMFSDIRGFTPLSEKMSPQENFNFINSYLQNMSPIIKEHRGFIDKYIGDAIMALFPTNADDAVRCSLAMLRRLKAYNQGRRRAGYRPIRIGIGLNTGLLMLGTVGDQHRMDGTVISDTVNLASRIENMTKTYGVSLLIGETTYFQLQNPGQYSIRIIDQVQAKGKSEPVTVFEVFDADPPRLIESKLKTLVLFKQGFKLYHRTKFAAAQKLFTEVLDSNPEDQARQIAEAKVLFQEILHVNPHDKVAQIYYQRCEQIEKYGVSEEWAGVWDWIEALKQSPSGA